MLFISTAFYWIKKDGGDIDGRYRDTDALDSIVVIIFTGLLECDVTS